MTNDLISQADALLGRYQALIEHAKIKPNAVISETIDIREALIEMVPGLVEEIKRLQVLECAAKANTTRRDEDIGDLMKELVKWQQVVIDRTAQIGWHTSCNCGRLPNDLRWPYCDWAQEIPQSVRDGWNEWAAKELGLQGYKTNGPIEINGERYVKATYIELLEKEFLDHTAARICYESIPGMSDYRSWHDYPEEPCQMRPKQWFRDQAQVALEKIRRG